MPIMISLHDIGGLARGKSRKGAVGDEGRTKRVDDAFILLSQAFQPTDPLATIAHHTDALDATRARESGEKKVPWKRTRERLSARQRTNTHIWCTFHYAWGIFNHDPQHKKTNSRKTTRRQETLEGTVLTDRCGRALVRTSGQAADGRVKSAHTARLLPSARH
jgi:hypothetical protein